MGNSIIHSDQALKEMWVTGSGKAPFYLYMRDAKKQKAPLIFYAASIVRAKELGEQWARRMQTALIYDYVLSPNEKTQLETTRKFHK